MALTAGYRLVRLMMARARRSHPTTEIRVEREITACGMRNNHVITNPIEMPMVPLANTTRRACKKMVFTMVLGLAPRALMMPSSRC